MSARPTKVAAGLILGAFILFGVGTNVQAGWVLVLSALLIGFAAAGATLPFFATRGLEVTRDAPTSARAGEAVPVSLIVRNASRGLRGPAGLRDDFCGSGWSVVGLMRPGEARRFTEMRTGARRGVYRSGTVGIASGAPFGVLIAWRDVEVASRTVVYPRVFPAHLPDAEGRTTVGIRSPDGDTSSIREYRHGDSPRHIHWRSSARRGELVVREFEESVRGDALVVADTPADPDVADAVASVACSLARAAIEQGRDLELRSGSGDTGAASYSVVDEWGAHLAPGGPPLDAILARPASSAPVCVLAAEDRNRPAVAVLRDIGSAVVYVVDPRSEDAPITATAAGFADALRSVGHTVRIVPTTTELGPWLSSPS